jgi:ssDNA-binding Zn-finger/Zn-ribbon topoisomerase 1
MSETEEITQGECPRCGKHTIIAKKRDGKIWFLRCYNCGWGDYAPP